MLSLLFNPDFILGNITGFALGAVLAAGLIHAGWAARERRLRLETERTRAHIHAAEASRNWQRAGAANDDRPRTARAELRSAPR